MGLFDRLFGRPKPKPLESYGSCTLAMTLEVYIDERFRGLSTDLFGRLRASFSREMLDSLWVQTGTHIHHDDLPRHLTFMPPNGVLFTFYVDPSRQQEIAAYAGTRWRSLQDEAHGELRRLQGQ